jgi:hypothetical protein
MCTVDSNTLLFSILPTQNTKVLFKTPKKRTQNTKSSSKHKNNFIKTHFSNKKQNHPTKQIIHRTTNQVNNTITITTIQQLEAKLQKYYKQIKIFHF